MAELVQRHMESMTEEILEMRRIKLFTVDETKIILKKRKEFEYKINGVSKNIKNFKDYIQYEKSLLKQIKLRRDKIKVADKRGSVEHRIMKRLKYIYDIATERFSDDFMLCLSHFKFCKKADYSGAAALAMQNLLKNFSYNPKIWEVAASWHFYDRKDIKTAFNVLQKGIAIHKSCEELYIKSIEFELLATENNNKKSEPLLELTCKKITAYVKAALVQIKNVKFYVDVLNLLENYDYTNIVQNYIIEKLLEDYAEEAVVWHCLALRALKGVHYKLEEEFENTYTFCIDQCIKRYEEGFKYCKESPKELWNFYLDTLLNLQVPSNGANELTKNALKNALSNAYEEDVLSEKHYIIWIELLNNEILLPEILKKATKALPDSIELWKLYLSYVFLENKISEINSVFEDAIECLKEKSLPIWMMCIRHHTEFSNEKELKSMFEKGIKQPQPISHILKPVYIEWLARENGISSARETFLKLAPVRPFCRNLINTMIKLEYSEDVNMNSLDQALKIGTQQFGNEEVEIWLEYLKFYIHFNSFFDLNDKFQEVMKSAEYVLPVHLQSELREKYMALLAEV